MTVGERIKHRRKELKMSADTLAEKINVSRSTIFRYEKGDIEKMPTDILANIAHALHTTPGELMGWGQTELEFEFEEKIVSIYNRLNDDNQKATIEFAEKLLEEQNSNVIDMRKWKDVYIQSKVSAGCGIVDLDQQYKELISYDGYVPEKYDLAFRVAGDSMEPLFRNDEVLFLEYDEEVRNGQIGVVLVDNEAYVKKMYVEGDHLRLVSCNKKYDDILVGKDKNIKVIGRVIL